jgi:hypothetical protein
MSAAKSTRKPARSSTGKASSGFTEEERAAMREYAKEVKAARHRGSGAWRGRGSRSAREDR